MTAADEIASAKTELLAARDLIVRLYAEVEALKVELYLAKVEKFQAAVTGEVSVKSFTT